MKPNVRQILRWTAVILFGGYGIRILIAGSFHAFGQQQGHWSDYLFSALFLTVLSASSLWVAYICFRQHYHRLVTVIAIIGAILICGTLITLPDRLGILEFFDRHDLDHPWLILISLPLSILFLVGPFYAAVWFFRFCHRLAAHYLYGTPLKARNS